MTALAVVVKLLFDFTLPIGGVAALRISFSGAFLRFASVVFGPAAGGAAAGLADLIKHFIKPEGAYLPPLTVTAAINGAFVGLLWKKLKNADVRRHGVFFVTFFGALGCWGAVNTLVIKLAREGLYLDFLRQIGAANEFINTNRIFISFGRIQATAGLIIISAAALIAYAVAAHTVKTETVSKYIRLLIATGVPCLLYTTLNTEILRRYFLLPDKAFALIWLPRFVEEAVMVFINAYLLTVMMKAYDKTVKTDFGGER